MCREGVKDWRNSIGNSAGRKILLAILFGGLCKSAPILKVRLEVFNVLGQRVATLVDEAQSAGAYRARWDGIPGRSTLGVSP